MKTAIDLVSRYEQFVTDAGRPVRPHADPELGAQAAAVALDVRRGPDWPVGPNTRPARLLAVQQALEAAGLLGALRSQQAELELRQHRPWHPVTILVELAEGDGDDGDLLAAVDRRLEQLEAIRRALVQPVRRDRVPA
jgi:hypothetical protein